MRLSKIDICFFRSIKQASLSIKELTAIVGENNAGKSAVLRAINSVFNFNDEKQFFENKSHQYSLHSQTKITLHFDDIPNDPFLQGIISQGQLIVRFVYNYSASKGGRRVCHIINGQEHSDTPELISIIKKYIDYVYIKASRNDDDLAWHENSIFKKIVTEYLAAVSKKRDSLSKKAQDAANSLKPIFESLCREVSTMNMLSTDEVFNISRNSPIDYSVFLQDLIMVIDNDESSLKICDYGSGIKSVTVIALYRLLAKMKKTAIILAIEEPETNLHPQAQKKLIASLKNDRQDGEVQAIFATHSTVIVDSLDHQDVVLVRRVPDQKRLFHSSISQLSSDFWQRYNIQEYKHANFFRVKNSDFFFAKYVIIVEGSADSIAFEHILRKKINSKLLDISIIQLDGVKNLQYPYFLLKELEIPFTAIVDYDFFTDYKYQKLSNSRDANGFPIYKNTLKNHPVINDIWDTNVKKGMLGTTLTQSYSRFFNFLKATPLLSLNYCLEMDLVYCGKTRQQYYSLLNIPIAKQRSKELLIQRHDAIKDPMTVKRVLLNVGIADYPNSFKKIGIELAQRINTLLD